MSIDTTIAYKTQHPQTSRDLSLFRACELVELDFFTQTQVITGTISCPDGMRILDMFNTPNAGLQNRKMEFIQIKESTTKDSESAQRRTIWLKKDLILFVLASDENLGRGVGARKDAKVYPFVSKTPMKLSVEVQKYVITGNLFQAKNQQTSDVLNDGAFFLPMTDVNITLGSQLFRTGPFAAINKQQIVSAVED